MAGLLAGILSLFGCGGTPGLHVLDGPGMVRDFRTEFAGTWNCAAADRTLVFTNETLTVVKGAEILFECEWAFNFGENNERCAVPLAGQMLGDYVCIMQKSLAPDDPAAARSVCLIAQKGDREDVYVFVSEDRKWIPSAHVKVHDNGWQCACGAVNDGKFCTNCGTKRPE